MATPVPCKIFSFERYITHIIEAKFRNNLDLNTFLSSFYRLHSPRFRNFNLLVTDIHNYGVGFDVHMITAFNEYRDFIDTTIRQHLDEIGKSFDDLEKSLFLNLSSDNDIDRCVANSLMSFFADISSFLEFGVSMAQKCEQLYATAVPSTSTINDNKVVDASDIVSLDRNHLTSTGSKFVRVLWVSAFQITILIYL